jgi:NaMN:DMB phosphoribosyltransferase
MAIGTTPWVVHDPCADLCGLAHEVSSELPVMAANLSFGCSRHAGLREYERFLVKEGVGAGGACIAAMLAGGLTVEELLETIDATYDTLLGRLNVL